MGTHETCSQGASQVGSYLNPRGFPEMLVPEPRLWYLGIEIGASLFSETTIYPHDTCKCMQREYKIGNHRCRETTATGPAFSSMPTNLELV